MASVDGLGRGGQGSLCGRVMEGRPGPLDGLGRGCQDLCGRVREGRPRRPLWTGYGGDSRASVDDDHKRGRRIAKNYVRKLLENKAKQLSTM
jgi:hypothetical protein